MSTSHRQIAQLWIDHVDGSYPRVERSGFNIYYVGETIYSYGQHFPIASFATGPDGLRRVLFTDRNYSISTAKHKGIVRSELCRSGYDNPILCSDPSNHDWKALAKECADKAEALRATAARRRSDRRRNWDLSDAEKYAQAAILFTRWAKLEAREAKD